MSKRREKVVHIAEPFVLRASRGEGLEVGYADFAFKSGTTEDVADNLLSLKLSPGAALQVLTGETAKDTIKALETEHVCTTK